ncbi:MAG: CPBP family intramembrane metalloprotease [Armatimonadetes bacterium]|nr:CPBP family intramembrane metalloprotease [Armatimonadota bacterium]
MPETNEPSAPEPTPDVVAPPPVVEPQTRAVWAWFVLGAIFIFLISSELIPDPKPEKPASAAAPELVVKLKSALVFKDAAIGASKTTQKDPLGDLIKEAEEDADKNSEASQVSLAAGLEAKTPLSTKALDHLKRSSEPLDQTVYKIYSSDKLEEKWVRGVDSQFPENFLGRLIRAHALAKAGVTGARSAVVSATDQALYVLLGLGFVFGAFLGLIALFGGIIALGVARIKPVGYPCGPLTKLGGDRLALRMSVFFLLFLVIPSVVAILLHKRLVPGASLFIGEVLLLISLVIVQRTPFFGVADPVKKIIGDTRRWPMHILYGLTGFCANIPVVVILALGGQALFRNAPEPTHPLTDQLESGASPLSWFFLYLLAAVMAPILEEISFRGLLLPALGRFMKPVYSILLTGFLFGAIHPQGPVLWAALASVGAMSAVLAYFSGSLIPSMTMHFIHNSAIMFAQFVLFT